jgi:hypothetical protein
MLSIDPRAGPRQRRRTRTASAGPHSGSGRDPIPQRPGVATETTSQETADFALNRPICLDTTRKTRAIGTARISCEVSLWSDDCERRFEMPKADRYRLLRRSLSHHSKSGPTLRTVARRLKIALRRVCFPTVLIFEVVTTRCEVSGTCSLIAASASWTIILCTSSY